MGYDDPKFVARHNQPFRLAAAANGTKGVFMSYNKLRLRAAHFRITTAGTTTGAAAGYTIRNGTTSLGACVFGTESTGVTSSVDLGDAEIASMGVINCLGGADATLVADVTYEYEILQDSAFSS